MSDSPPNSEWLSFRSIAEDARVSEELDRRRPQWSRLDDAWLALTWLLARRGYAKGLMRKTGGVVYHLYRQAGLKAGNVPDITVLFTVGEAVINIHGVSVSAPTEEAEDAST